MTDNVVPIKGGVVPSMKTEEPSADEAIAAIVKQQIEESIAEISKCVAQDEVRSLIVITMNYDGTVSWSVSGRSSAFEIIASLERVKIDFMNSE